MMRGAAQARRASFAYFPLSGSSAKVRADGRYGRNPSAAAYALIPVGNVVFEALAEGGLWWEDERLLVVADLHLEKGSSFARRRQFLPPYDTAATLAALSVLVMRLNPRTVIALGDSFHDDDGAKRLHSKDRATLAAIQANRDWVWIAGNHDPAPTGLNGDHSAALAVGSVCFRHEPSNHSDNEIAGHFHPAARVAGKFGSTRRSCFVGNGRRLILPAFGAYAGGLNILDPAFAPLFGHHSFRAFVIGDKGVYPVHGDSLRPD